MNRLIAPYRKNGFELKNHLIMAPMTRSRAINNLPNELMAEYYGQRTGAGLIVAKGTAPLADGLGYPRIPGVYSGEQVAGWKKVTEAVHRGGSQFFLQLMHTGRIAHQDNVPEGGQIVAPSAIRAAGKMFTDTQGLQDFSDPRALTREGIERTVVGHGRAAKNAQEAGFDGVELHGANGYLVEQFLNPHVNQRDDEYGGNREKRARFVVETVQALADAVGADKVGIRFSPYSTFNDQPAYDPEEVHETYAYLAKRMNDIGIRYIHVSMVPDAPQKTYQVMRENFAGTMIQCNGLTPETALQALDGLADLVAFARNFLANPDLAERIAQGAALNEPNPDTFYTLGAEGYTDYPTLEQEQHEFQP